MERRLLRPCQPHCQCDFINVRKNAFSVSRVYTCGRHVFRLSVCLIYRVGSVRIPLRSINTSAYMLLHLAVAAAPLL